MTRARDLAFIRKLCALGLPPQTLAPCLLPALRALVASHSAAVFWVDDQGEMSGLYAERMLPPDAMADYYARHYHERTNGFALAFKRRAASEDPVCAHSFSRAEQATAYFRDVMARLDAYHVLYGVLKSGDRAFGQVSLYRGRADRPFGTEDAETLRSLLRYLASGLAPRTGSAEDPAPSVVVEEHLGIANADGSIASAPEPWHRLLRLVALNRVAPRDAAGESSTVQAFLRQLCDSALAPERSVARPLEANQQSPWGRFSLRAFRLPDVRGRRADQIGLLIRREEPRAVTLVRGTGVSALSPQQREVALLLAQGKSNREIADQLGLTFNTASYHVKQVYDRLEVNDRGAVGEKLLRLAQATAGA
jgi:DNA-binding CsgD family transcriptional regulator